jgi:hypothetical protein
MTDYLVKSPNQASTVYGLDGPSAPRKRGFFYVRFKRAGSKQAASGWETNMGFLVKSLDRPTIEPQIETLNQYNKKRQITVGYTMAPMRVTLFDTADSMVMQMWNEYSQWYFGDFRQYNQSSWAYDVTTSDFRDNGQGYGYQPRPSTSSTTDQSLDQNSQFFFDVIEVYQVFGGQYVQFDLVNPKIKNFDPDEMDYGSSEASTITMSIVYEAILYRNGNKPAEITSNQLLSLVFNQQFNGNTFDVVGAPVNQNTGTSTPSITSSPTLSFLNTTLAGVSASAFTPSSTNSTGGGSLSQFGNYDFGSLSPNVSLGNGLQGDVSYLSTGNNSLSSILNLPVGTPAITTPESLALNSNPNAPMTAISAGQLNNTQATLQNLGAGSNPYAASYINNNLTGGVAASSILSGNSANDQITPASGLALNSQSYGIVNAQLPSYSQIGYNASSSPNYEPNYSSPSSSSDVFADASEISV